ncbi:uncharacterized protein T551_01035 [Pneumocystis jirovecii RU7]|uniref:GTP-binding protein n=2 Tax=Pneumocystis jirovecii TaxID=42068 RepID=A0A0W4ZTQ0_PNEJ7|nr:uncharacterized protein T551_01035 [Pneumocystis jirovecii RU7]KTW31774.1 hypothetical protein T551_01035 [Pneumocystis jirovecii RU7]
MTLRSENSIISLCTYQPRLLLMGLRRSGKSSIRRVMPPNETLFLESTNRINKDEVNSFIDFQVWDFPGQIDFFDSAFDLDAIFGKVGALIFVIDSQDEYLEALTKLHITIIKALTVNPNINIEVFIHKADTLSDDYKIDTQRDIQQRAFDELSDSGLDNISVSFHLTSIFDYSIFEAFSKVIQKLIPQLPTLENLLNIFCSNSVIEKAYLFDISSKIYIATDSSPVDVQSYEICSDYIDVILDVSEIYGYERKNSLNNKNTTDETEISSIIRLSNGMALYFQELNRYLALVCLIRTENLEKHSLLEYNIQCFSKAIKQIMYQIAYTCS